jgi:hypothetical protein
MFRRRQKGTAVPEETPIVQSPAQPASKGEAGTVKGARRGAIGKALIVWLATGSLGAAVVAFLIFWLAGC